jgi:riboflavin transporter FmnP
MTAGKPTPSPVVAGAVAGAVSGLIVLLVFVLINHFIFSGDETRRYGLVATLVGAGALGICFGAVIGVVVGLSGSMAIGIAAGAIAMAAIRLVAAGEFAVLNLIMGLIYGAIFGWVVASGVGKSLEQSG